MLVIDVHSKIPIKLRRHKESMSVAVCLPWFEGLIRIRGHIQHETSAEVGTTPTILIHKHERLNLPPTKCDVTNCHATPCQVHPKLVGCPQGCKEIINFVPERWQGYARAARVFLKEPTQEMMTMALDLSLLESGVCETRWVCGFRKLFTQLP